MRIEPEIDSVSTILVGRFNPAIFTPAWFALCGLLPKNAAESADLAVVHPQITQFSTDWLQLMVTQDRFEAETMQSPHIRIHDLVVRLFREHLQHTPLTAFGINRHVHFRVASLAVRDRLGKTLAPVEPWGDWGCKLGLDGEYGGMISLTMSQLDPEGRSAGGEINIKVEPSIKIGEKQTGVYVGVNDHYIIDHSKPGSAERSMDLLEANFTESLRRSEQIIDHIMSLAINREA